MALAFDMHAQGFQPPAKGKAVVYFTRVSSFGLGASFEFFHNDKYIGVFKGKNYMRYECDPGKQIFWASSENKEFITAELQEGCTYIVIVDVIMGAFLAHVGLTPIGANNTDVFERAKKLINSKPPVKIPEAQIVKMNKKLQGFIAEKLQTYEEKWKNERNFKRISPEMAIPADELK